jgi:hypothetical protein
MRTSERSWLNCSGIPGGCGGFGQKPIREALQDIANALEQGGLFPA